MSIEDEQRRFQEEGLEGEVFGEYLVRTAARMDMARAAVDSGFVTPEQGARLLDHGTMTLTDVVHAESPAPPPKRGRVPAFIPVRRLDGRR